MARRNTKKQPEAHKIDCAEVFAALRELEKTKGIPVDYMVERMKQGMANAYRKDREDRRDVPADNVVVDFQESGLSVHVVKTVVDDLWDTALEIHIDAAKISIPTPAWATASPSPWMSRSSAASLLRPSSRF